MKYFRMNTFLITLFFAWITVSSHPADSVQTIFGSKEIQIGVGGFGPTLQKAITALNERNKKANNMKKDEPIQTESFSQEEKEGEEGGEEGEEGNASETETVTPGEQQTESTSPTTTTVSSSDTTTQQTTTNSSLDETTATITTTAKTEPPEAPPSPGTTTLKPEQNNGSKMHPSLVQTGIFFLTIKYLLELKL